jgi:hypothetical protein
MFLDECGNVLPVSPITLAYPDGRTASVAGTSAIAVANRRELSLVPVRGVSVQATNISATGTNIDRFIVSLRHPGSYSDGMRQRDATGPGRIVT